MSNKELHKVERPDDVTSFYFKTIDKEIRENFIYGPLGRPLYNLQIFNGHPTTVLNLYINNEGPLPIRPNSTLYINSTGYRDLRIVNIHLLNAYNANSWIVGY